MKIVDVSFDKNENNTGEGCWLLSHGVPNVFSSFRCKIGARDFFISTSKALQAVLDDNNAERPSLDELELIPLYRNCLVDKPKMKKHTTILIRVLTDVSEIATVKLDGCYGITPVITDRALKDGIKQIALGVSVEPGREEDFTIKILRMDGAAITIYSNGISQSKVIHRVKKPNKRISVPSLIIMPKKSHITNDLQDRHEGYMSVHMFDVISKYNKIVESAKDTDYTISKNLTRDQLDAVAETLENQQRLI